MKSAVSCADSPPLCRYNEDFRSFENIVGDVRLRRARCCCCRLLIADCCRACSTSSRPHSSTLSWCALGRDPKLRCLFLSLLTLTLVQLHVTKNFLADEHAFGDNSRVPLILGIWGGKGQGKVS